LATASGWRANDSHSQLSADISVSTRDGNKRIQEASA
jgi:hypothetical protein